MYLKWCYGFIFIFYICFCRVKEDLTSFNYYANIFVYLSISFILHL